MDNKQPPDSMSWLMGIVFTFLIVFGIFGTVSAASVCELYPVNDENSFLNGVGITADNNVYVAGKFTSTSTYTTCAITAIGVRIQRNGGRTDNAVVKIYSDNAGVPGSVLEAGTTLVTTSSFTWATSTFGGTTLLASSTPYWVIVTAPNAGNNFYWANGLAGVSKQSANGTSWSNGNNSTLGMSFEIDGTIVGGGGGGGGGSGSATSTATTTTAAFTGYLPSKQEDLFMFGLITFLLALIALRTLFFTV